MLKRKTKERAGYTLSIFAIIGLFIAYPIAIYNSEQTLTIKVISKERITEGSGEDIHSKYLIYTDNEVFENVDSWLYFKFNSSDVYDKLKENTSYEVKVVGWRVPFLSWYRNIVEVNSNKH